VSDEPRKLVELGGRRFAVVNYARRTVLLDHHVGHLIRKSGVDKVVPMPDDGEGDAANKAYLMRLQTALLDSGMACEVIAGFLLPEGKVERDWTPQMAKDTAAFIGRLDTQEDRELVVQLAMDAVLGFFLDGIRRLAFIRASLEAAESERKSSGNEASETKTQIPAPARLQ
jgi:hypothetical protein